MTVEARSGWTRRAAAIAAALLAIAAAIAAVCSVGPPARVWTPRAPDSPGDASLTVHDTPAGTALAGRWVFADGIGAGARMVLVRLALDRGDGTGALERLVAGDEVVYESTGRSAPLTGADWYEWRLRAP